MWAVCELLMLEYTVGFLRIFFSFLVLCSINTKMYNNYLIYFTMKTSLKSISLNQFMENILEYLLFENFTVLNFGTHLLLRIILFSVTLVTER